MLSSAYFGDAVTDHVSRGSVLFFGFPDFSKKILTHLAACGLAPRGRRLQALAWLNMVWMHIEGFKRKWFQYVPILRPFLWRETPANVHPYIKERSSFRRLRMASAFWDGFFPILSTLDGDAVIQ